MDLIRLGLGLDGKGAIVTLNQFTGSAHNAARAGGQLEKGVRSLQGAFAGIAAYFGTRQLIEYADTWTLINSRIGLVTESTEMSMAVQMRLYNIAQRTRNTMAATSVLYTRLALNASELGISHEDMLDMVESVNAALLRSGATGVEAAQSMRQFAQALGKGRLDGDEFRTVMEAMPEVAKAIARQFGVAREQLYDLSEQGKISAQEIIQAMLNVREEFLASIGDMPITFEQAMILFTNAVEMHIGIISHAINTNEKLGAAVAWVIENMEKLIAVIAAAIAASISYRLALIAAAGAYQLLVLWTRRAVIWQGIVTGAQTVRAFFSLARSVRSVADATALLGMVSKNVYGVLAAIAAVTVGIVAYRKMVEEITRMTDEWANAQADLNDKLGEQKTPEDEALAKARSDAEEMIRLARQQLYLADLAAGGADERTLERLGIVIDAYNKEIDARKTLQGEALAVMLEAIRTERELLLLAEEFNAVAEKRKAFLEEQRQMIKNVVQNMQRSFADAFARIFERGFRTFNDLWQSMKDLFFRALSEIMASEMMKRFGSALATGFAGVMGLSKSAVAQANDRAMSGDLLDANLRAALESGSTQADLGKIPVELAGVQNSVERSFVQTFLSALGPLLAGFGVGSMVGGMTSNRLLGTAGGALSGAATGALIGSVIPGIGTAVGGVLGGVAGAIGGLIGSNNRHREELERHRQVLESNNKALRELERSVYGTGRGGELVNLARIVEILLRQGNFDNWVAARPAGGQWMTRQELIDAAAQLGITIDGSRESYEQLAEYLELAILELTTFGRNLRDINMSIEAYNNLFDVEDTPLQRLKDSFRVLSEMAPELVEKLGLTNVDLTTEAGRQMLLEGLREIYNMIEAGLLSPELLGAFSDKNQLLETVLRTKEAFDQLNEEIYKVTTDFPRAMDIIYYEQRFGRYGVRPPGNPIDPNTSTVPNPGFFNYGSITVVNEAGDTPIALYNKIERGREEKYNRGGRVN